MENSRLVGKINKRLTFMLHLAKDGIFPIVKDAAGHPLSSLPASGFPFAGTIQGEGKLCGIPSLFVRVAGCNLHCHWSTSEGKLTECDTAYAAYRLQNTFSLETEEICRLIRANTENLDHIVITGGEPFLQADALTNLCKALKQSRKYHVSIETNATLYDKDLVEQIDFFSLSPKLSSSQSPAFPGKQKSGVPLNPLCIQQFIDHARSNEKDFQLKFVYTATKDIQEIKTLLSSLKKWHKSDILLMPLGTTPTEVQAHSRETLRHCLQNGWRYCDRLHLTLFGPKEGV